MNHPPLLILQMQRMGDLILSFPLLGWLAAVFPGHPLWVVGESVFFEPLLPLSPRAVYFNYEGASGFKGQTFHAVLNLSHRPEAARLAASVRADTLIGPYLDKDGALRIRGDWQIYRASLTHNNRYNLFHWADLNALDLIPRDVMLRTAWPLPRTLPSASRGAARVGLFLGASEPDKHPEAAFWAHLARLLLKAGHKPVLLGGAAEKKAGRQVAETLKAPSLNLCGRFSVDALARFLAGLDLFITPDTGPMHIAAWTGTPVLNLSLGPVNPWETGPFSPGNHVLRPALECIGCWSCTRPRVECKSALTAGRVASVTGALLAGRPFGAVAPRARGMEILRTARDAHGLFALENFFTSPPQDAAFPAGAAPFAEPPPLGPGTSAARDDLSRFWHAWFGALFRRLPPEDPRKAWARVARDHPAAAAAFARSLGALAQALAGVARSGAAILLRDPDFWREVPAPVRPLSGYLQMYVQNAPSRSSLLHAFSLVEQLRAETGEQGLSP
jgi:ADP-heptose:LPS heptosyltransferase